MRLLERSEYIRQLLVRKEEIEKQAHLISSELQSFRAMPDDDLRKEYLNILAQLVHLL